MDKICSARLLLWRPSHHILRRQNGGGVGGGGIYERLAYHLREEKGMSSTQISHLAFKHPLTPNLPPLHSPPLPSPKYPSKLLSVKSTVVPKLFSCNTFAKCMQLMMYLPHRRKMWESLTTVTENGALQIISFTLATKTDKLQVTTCGWMADLFYQMQSVRTKKVSLSINIPIIKTTEIMGPTLQSK